MTLIIILLAIFASVAVMVMLGERFGKPMEPQQQAKFSKIAIILVFVLLVVAIIKAAT